MEVLSNEGYEDGLILEFDSSQSRNSERPESPEIAMISNVSNETTPKTSPSFCLPLPQFAASDMNTDIENKDVMSFVNLYITDNFHEHVCEQTQLYASKVISAAPHPFTELSLFQTFLGCCL
jgi:hypothetical protein